MESPNMWFTYLRKFVELQDVGYIGNTLVHVRAIFTMKQLSIKSYVSPLYLNITLSSIYRGVINSLGDHRQWQIPDDIISIVILLSNVKRAIGRPNKISIPSKLEFKRCVKCDRCGHVGHNRKRCKFSLLN